MSTNAIVVDNLVKRYPGGVTAVDGVSFSVQGGQIFGFLGPNGAGKSTIIKILTTLALPSEGLATVGGYDVVYQAGDVRRIAGVALQEIGLDPTMKSSELLTPQARVLPRKTWSRTWRMATSTSCCSRRSAARRAHEVAASSSARLGSGGRTRTSPLRWG